MSTRINKKIKLSLITLLTFLAILSFAGFFGSKSFAKADQTSTYKVEEFVPNTSLEYYDLSSPIYTYHDDDVTAIAQSNKKLIVYYNGAFTELEYNTLGLPMFEDIKQVKRLDANTLLVLDRASIYTVNLNDLTADKIACTLDGTNLNGSYFDFNGKNLVTSFKSYINVYEFDGTAIISKGSISGGADSPLALNNNGDMFFVDQQTLCMQNLANGFATPIELVKNVSITQMIANDNFLYYVSNMQIYRLNLSTKETTLLSVKYINEQDKAYNLGKIVSPESICFRGENLLVTDNSLNAVQEFIVDGENLIFTGFAIAENKTAYNRIQKDATDIEKSNGKIAVLDGKKLSVMSQDCSQSYARDNFVNFIIDENTDVKYDTTFFALGLNKIMISATTPQRILMLDVNNNQSAGIEITIPAENCLIDDICYQSGFFYVLVHTASHSIVYSISEFDENFTATEQFKVESENEKFSLIEVDVFKNVYLAKTNELYKFPYSGDGYALTDIKTLPATNKLTKIKTGLAGELFVLDDGAINYYDENSSSYTTLLSNIDDLKVKSFALDFDSKEVFILTQDSEMILSTIDLPNLCVNDIEVPTADYVTTDKTADINDLKAYTIKDGANLYSVSILDGKFNFICLADRQDKYLLICPITISNGYQEVAYYALAGQDQVVLAHYSDLIESQIALEAAPQSAFITTDVNMYYMPIITPNHEYALSNEQVVIRLTKGSKIEPIKLFTLLDKQFYYATVIIDGEQVNGYIPVAFTVEVLSKDIPYDNFTFERVNPTTLYKDTSLTESIMELEDNQQVKVLDVENDVMHVLIETEDGFIEGYISIDSVKNQPKQAIRNIILIVLVSACVCATTAYFFIKKKSQN